MPKCWHSMELAIGILIAYMSITTTKYIVFQLCKYNYNYLKNVTNCNWLPQLPRIITGSITTSELLQALQLLSAFTITTVVTSIPRIKGNSLNCMTSLGMKCGEQSEFQGLTTRSSQKNVTLRKQLLGQQSISQSIWTGDRVVQSTIESDNKRRPVVHKRNASKYQAPSPEPPDPNLALQCVISFIYIVNTIIEVTAHVLLCPISCPLI